MTTEANFWVLAQPAPDIPGMWVAHCLDLDLVSQGSTFRDSLVMLTESLTVAIESDMSEGRDPFARSAAPKEDWDVLHRVQRTGRFLEHGEVSSGLVAMQLRVSTRGPIEMDKPSHPAISELPPRWLANTAASSPMLSHA